MDSREEILDILKMRLIKSHSQRTIRKSEIIKGDAQIFAKNAQGAGAKVVIVGEMEAAKNEIVKIISELKGDIVYSSEELIKEIDVAALAKGTKRTIIEAEAESIKNYKEKVITSKIGITACLFAIQETGSIVISHDKYNESLISLAPENHICLLKAEQILVNQYMLASKSEEKTRLPSSYTIITGASYANAIELQKISGMYGPKNLFIIIIK